MKRIGKALFAALLVITMVCIGATRAEADPSWWDSNWSMRAEINIASVDALASGYSVAITIPHATYVSAGTSLANGNDVRVVRWDGSAWTELDRIVDSGSSWNSATTKIWFRTQTAISASTSDNSYWIYYANSNAGAPPADGNNIFDVYDDFSSGSVNASKWVTVNVAGVSVDVTGGELRISGTNTLGSTYAPAGIRSVAALTGNNAMESRFRIVNQSTTARDNWKANFGLDSSYMMVNSQLSSTKRVQYYTSSWNDIGPSSFSGTTFGFQRVSESLSNAGVASHWENGALQTTRSGIGPISYDAAFYYSPDTDNGGETFDVRFDDVAIRKFVANEPTITLGGADGAGALMTLSVTVDPSLTFTVSGKNANCNGLTNTIGSNATPTAVPLGHVASGNRGTGAQDLNVQTNAGGGFSVKLRSSAGSTPVMKGLANPANTILDTAPGPLPALGTSAFGFTTDDTGVAMTSGNVAPVPLNNSSTDVMSAAAGVTNRSACVAYFASIASNTVADTYQVTALYTAIPSY